MGDTTDAEQAPEPGEVDSPSAGRKRQRSLIEFPYTDLERAVEMASTLHREGGQARIETTQLAVAMNQSANGGTFRGRLGAAKMFGLLETEQGKVGLTPLGLRVTDRDASSAALAEAFLMVPLYSAMYERYNGYALPPASAIERQMESLGVPQKQKVRARQAFSASAQYAGFIAANGRFSKPTGTAQPAAPHPPDDTHRSQVQDNKSNRTSNGGSGGGAGGGNDGGPSKHPPFIDGLLQTLPPPKSDWPASERADWLQTAASIFKLIYKGQGTIEVKVIEPKKDDGG